jgi:hypothetical protein
LLPGVTARSSAQEASATRRPSHGYIRKHDRDIVAWLARHVGIGTPVRII